MYQAIEYVLEKGYDSCVLIGTDIPELKCSDLEYAFRLLDVNDVVFGPTVDEGYYLVGMKRPVCEVFEKKTYGTGNVLEQTVQPLQEMGLTILFIAHNLSVVKYFSDRIGVMYFGKLVEMADSNELFKNPLHPYTKALFSAVPVPNPDVKMHRIILEGDIPSPANPPRGCKFHTRCAQCMNVCKFVPPRYAEVKPEHFVACHLYDEEIMNNLASYDEQWEQMERDRIAAEAAAAPKVEEKKEEAVAEITDHEPEISFDDFCKVELRVAEVRACENMKESKKLLHLTVFDGERERCILSGIAKWFKPEDLIGKKIGIVCNLAPRPMMKGKYVSEGMIFAADTADGGCSIAFYGDDTPVGSRIH